MNSSFDFDSRLSAWLDEQAVSGAPDALLGQVAEAASHTRRRPAWATLERWISMETRAQFGAVPRTAIILVVLGVLLALFSAIAIGQQPSPKLPAPLGVARNGLIAFDDGGDIYVVNPDGSGRRQLTSGSATDTAPEWSEDGTRIAYWSEQEPNGTFTIKVMDTDGSHLSTLVDGVTQPPASWRISWSHDGRFLAYADRMVQGPRLWDRIMVVPVAGGDPVELVSPGQAPTWSPDDTMIGYQSGGMSKDIKKIPQGLSVIRTDRTGQQLIDGASTANEWAYAYPQWSPDSRQVTYHAQLPGDFAVIDVATVTGSAVQAIGPQAADAVWPMWSPDGSRIAYLGPSTTDGKYQIGVVAPDGSGLRTLDHPPLGCNCVDKWSPDGTKVITYLDVVGQESTGGSLMVVDADGKAPVLNIPITGVTTQEMSWQRLAP
jgi:Tol biopolymer transport system component